MIIFKFTLYPLNIIKIEREARRTAGMTGMKTEVMNGNGTGRESGCVDQQSSSELDEKG